VKGRRRRGVFFVTTTYGITLAVDSSSGRILWKFEPNGIGAWEGSYQITNTTPVADPSRRAIYAASPTARSTSCPWRAERAVRLAGARDPRRLAREAGRGAQHLRQYVIPVTGGYLGDAPPYQGHVLAIDRASGRIAHVFNTLCSDRQDQVLDPARAARATRRSGSRRRPW